LIVKFIFAVIYLKDYANHSKRSWILS